MVAKKKTEKEQSTEISYKNYEYLAHFVTERGKIVGRKRTGITPKQQRLLAREIKRARFLGLLPFKSQV